MEDRMHVLCDPDSNFSVFSIYDGHGGEFVSDYLEKNYSPNIRHSVLKITSPDSKGEDYAQAVKKVSVETSDFWAPNSFPWKSIIFRRSLMSPMKSMNTYNKKIPKKLRMRVQL